MRKLIAPLIVHLLLFSTIAIALMPAGPVAAQGGSSREVTDLVSVSNGLTNQGQWNTLRFADLNKDQYLDIVGGTWASGMGLAAYTSNNGNSWTGASTGLPNTGSYGLGDIGDITGDGNVDLVVPYENSYSAGTPNGIEVWKGNGGAGGTVSWTKGTGPTNTGSFSGVGVGDVDADGKLDIAATPQTNPAGIRFWQGDGGTTWTNKSVGLPLTGTYFGIRIADMNKDGRKDLVVAAPAGVKVYTANADLSWTDNSSGLNTAYSTWNVRVADFDKDGNMDILTSKQASGVRVFTGNGGAGGTLTFTEESSGLPNANDYEAIAVGNVDRDGNPDIITGSDWTGFGPQLYLGNGGTGGSMSFTRAGQTDLPANGDYLAMDIGDFNNDGTGDLLMGKGYSTTGLQVYKTIASLSKPPVAEAGPDQTVWVGQLVHLDGTGSTDDTKIAMFDWNISSKPNGATVALSDESNVTPTFTPTVAGDYLLTLQVKDEHNQWALLHDSMTVHAKVFPNARPIAKAGDDKDVLIFTKVQLNGSESWDDAQIIAYNWNMTGKPSDSQVVLNDEAAVAPTFSPDYIGVYKFTLTVEDVNKTWAKDDEVKITAKPAGKGPPTANAGPDATIELADTVALNGSASADDQSIVLYDWSVESQPPGSDLALQDKMVQNITPLAVGPYVLTLKVKDNDNLWSVSSDSMALTVLPKNLDPEAKITEPADGTTFLSTEVIKFDGTQSADPEGSDLVYQWTSSREGQLSTESSFSKNLSVGEHRITLYVTDDHGHKVSTSVNIVVKPDDLPVAKLTSSKTPILKTEKVTFDGSKSSDVQGAIAQYYYDFGDGQNSGWVTGSSNSHQYKTAGKFPASLKVRDGKGQESAASLPVEVIVGERPNAALTSDLSSQTSNLPVNLDASGSTDPDSKVAQYYFDFGDGTNSGWVPDRNMTKVYATPGNYQVTVKVRDDMGFESINNAQVSLLVSAPKKHSSGGFGNLLLPLLAVIIIVIVAVAVAIVMMRRKAPAPHVPVQQPQMATTLPPPPPASYYQQQAQPVQPQQPQYYDQSGYGQNQQQYQQQAYDPSGYPGYDATGQQYPQYQQYQQPPQQ